jgi:hypothetical protein
VKTWPPGPVTVLEIAADVAVLVGAEVFAMVDDAMADEDFGLVIPEPATPGPVNAIGFELI